MNDKNKSIKTYEEKLLIFLQMVEPHKNWLMEKLFYDGILLIGTDEIKLLAYNWLDTYYNESFYKDIIHFALNKLENNDL